VTHNSIDSGKNASDKSCVLECLAASHAIARLSFENANALRKASQSLPGNFGYAMLKHCDEQSLMALAAVGQAIERIETRPADFSQWGVIVSSRYLGRAAFAQSLAKFAIDGPWNVSVQVVPHRSLHSPASTLGLSLGCHGPCLGVGGGLDGEIDAWLTASILLEQQSLPGIWMVFTGWEPERPIDVVGNLIGDVNCTALAIALQPAVATSHGLRFRITFDRSADQRIEVPARHTALELFEQFVTSSSNDDAMTASLGGGLRVEIHRCNESGLTIPLVSPQTSHQKAA
jgi:hypothetical protein